jgi:hypothetical protein
MKQTIYSALLFLALAITAPAQTLSVYSGVVNDPEGPEPFGFRSVTRGFITSLVDGNLITLTAYDSDGLETASFAFTLDNFATAEWTSDFIEAVFTGSVFVQTTGPAALSPALVRIPGNKEYAIPPAQ